MSTCKKTSLLRWIKGFMQKHIRGMMTCKEFENFVLDYVENELPDQQRARFQLHLRLCRECRQYLQAYLSTLEVSRAAFDSPDAPVPDDVPEELIAAILRIRND